jgi:hypothetical protein
MKKFFRSVVFLLLVGGWGLACSALTLVRTSSTSTPFYLMTKDRPSLPWHDTYVDTRKWTIDDVRSHPFLVTKLVRLGKADLFAQTVSPKEGTTLEAKLTSVVQPPAVVQK